MLVITDTQCRLFLPHIVFYTKTFVLQLIRLKPRFNIPSSITLL